MWSTARAMEHRLSPFGRANYDNILPSETPGLPPYPRKWAGRVAVGEGPEAGLLGEPTWAGAIIRNSGNRQRSKADAQPPH